MSLPAPRHVTGSLALRPEKRCECSGCARQPVAVQVPESDIHVVLLPETPPVTVELRGKIELRLLGEHGERRLVAGIDGKLRLLGHDEPRIVDAAVQESSHRTEVTARTNKHRGPE